jgi:hypothetical protein
VRSKPETCVWFCLYNKNYPRRLCTFNFEIKYEFCSKKLNGADNLRLIYNFTFMFIATGLGDAKSLLPDANRTLYDVVCRLYVC